MTTTDSLQSRYPTLGARLGKLELASLPTPVRAVRLKSAGVTRTIWIKEDQYTADTYGGNKVRKLEHLLAPACRKQRRVVATFGAAGSHHALATALYGRALGFECIAFLGHQAMAPSVAATLNMHVDAGTTLVRYGGGYRERLATLREHLWGRDAWVVPAGGSSWRGTAGFVNAGLELAEQVDAGLLPRPARVYVASGTMGTAAGLALGFAIAGLDTTVHAVRVSDTSYANEAVVTRLVDKTVAMFRRLDDAFPAIAAGRLRLALRHEFFAGGYARTSPDTDAAIAVAAGQFGVTLEGTYTGKAMAALLHDAGHGAARDTVLFWNTYHGRPLPVGAALPDDVSALPEGFVRYFF